MRSGSQGGRLSHPGAATRGAAGTMLLCSCAVTAGVHLADLSVDGKEKKARMSFVITSERPEHQVATLQGMPVGQESLVEKNLLFALRWYNLMPQTLMLTNRVDVAGPAQLM